MNGVLCCLIQYYSITASFSLCCVAVTESSETSSQCTSSESVTGLSTLTIPGHTSIAMDSYNNNESPSFLCSSTPPSSIASPSIFQKEEDLQPQGTKFITAVSVWLSSLFSPYTKMTWCCTTAYPIHIFSCVSDSTVVLFFLEKMYWNVPHNILYFLLLILWISLSSAFIY